jgi:hypothetical protein
MEEMKLVQPRLHKLTQKYISVVATSVPAEKALFKGRRYIDRIKKLFERQAIITVVFEVIRTQRLAVLMKDSYYILACISFLLFFIHLVFDISIL